MERVREVCLVAGGDSGLLLVCFVLPDNHRSTFLASSTTIDRYTMEIVPIWLVSLLLLYLLCYIYYTGYLLWYTLQPRSASMSSTYSVSASSPYQASTTTYLFDSLRGQHNGMLVPDTHAVFNSDSNSAESLGPSIAIRHIYTAEQRVSWC